MAQHDYDLANATGQNFRADANNALAAIVSQNSGTAEPTTTFAYMWWADTTDDLLKLRNAANTAWVTVGSLSADGLGLAGLAGGTFTGAILAAVGLTGPGPVNLPGIAFTGDTNTGIRWISADKMALVIGGVDTLILDAASYPQLISTAAVLMPSGTTAQRPTGAAGLLRYNSTTAKFEGYSGGLWKDVGGGGGGAGFEWKEVGGNVPIPTEEYGELPYMFGAGLAQELYAAVKVPQSYAAGSPILIYVSGYSPSAANTILLKAQSTLIRSGTDAFDSTTNQRTTTNAALTNATAKVLRQFSLDITDSTGLINGVSVSAGDVIKVRLYRDTDTDTADLRMLPNGTDVKFS